MTRNLRYVAEALRAVASSAPFDPEASARSKCMSAVNSFVTRNAPRTLVAFGAVFPPA